LKLGESCEDSCVDGIGFCKFSKSFGKVSCLLGIEERDCYSLCREVGEELSFESSGGFKDDLYRVVFLEEFQESPYSFKGVWNGELLVRWEDVYDEFFFCDVDTDEVIFVLFHGSLFLWLVKKSFPC